MQPSLSAESTGGSSLIHTHCSWNLLAVSLLCFLYVYNSTIVSLALFWYLYLVSGYYFPKWSILICTESRSKFHILYVSDYYYIYYFNYYVYSVTLNLLSVLYGAVSSGIIQLSWFWFKQGIYWLLYLLKNLLNITIIVWKLVIMFATPRRRHLN